MTVKNPLRLNKPPLIVIPASKNHAIPVTLSPGDHHITSPFNIASNINLFFCTSLLTDNDLSPPNLLAHVTHSDSFVGVSDVQKHVHSAKHCFTLDTDGLYYATLKKGA